MMKKTLLLLLPLLACLAFEAAAQFSLGGIKKTAAPEPVVWSVSAKKSDGKHAIVTLTATIEKGWHLYGTQLPEGGPKATEFDFAKSTDVRIDAAPEPDRKPLTVDDPLFDMKLNWWDSTVSFAVPVTVTGNEPVVSVTVSFMTCDGNSCMPPKKITKNINIKHISN